MDFPNYEEEPQIIRTQLHEEYDEEDLQQAAAKGKMKIKRIENITNRQVTFCKRRNGLLKKAYELSVLCDAEVALVIFSTRGRLYEYANNSVRSTIERYMKTCADTSNIGSANTQFYQQEASKLRREIKARQQNLEAKLEKSITKIRTKKTEALFAEIELMQKREIELQHANMYLQAQISINERVQQLSLLPGASVVDHGQYHQALASDSQR